MLPFIKSIVGKARYDSWYYGHYYRRLLKRDGMSLGMVKGEENYLNQWRKLCRSVEPYTFRYFARFCNASSDIVPDYILHNQIEPCINPCALWDIYEDKNRFSLYLGKECLPETVLCRVAGGEIADADHRPLAEAVESVLKSCRYEALIMKPALGTSCGERIMRFNRVGNGYQDLSGRTLDREYLLGYDKDWILQQCIVPHPFMLQFCSTAVSTLRLAVYRSVVDGQSAVTGAVLRVGREGTIVDNTSAGGCYVGISLKSGTLQRSFYDVRGNGRSVWNQVDLTKQTFTVPNWQAILSMAHRVAAKIPDHHLLALDIALNEDGTPMVLEYNIGGFSAYLFHQVGQLPLGGFAGEVVDYCLQQR